MLTPLNGMLSPLTRRVAVGYAAYAASLAPVLWLRLRETTGSVAANSGTGSTALDGAITSATLGQSGGGNQGVNEAYLFDGANSLITVPASTLINNLTTFTYAMLCRPTTAGETSSGYFLNLNNYRSFTITSAACPIRCYVLSNSAAADSVSAAGFAALNTWQWVFATYDNAGDRKVHLYRGVAGVLTEATYATQIAMTGTIFNASGAVSVGNRLTQDRTFNGLIDEAQVFSRALTAGEMLKLIQLSGV